MGRRIEDIIAELPPLRQYGIEQRYRNLNSSERWKVVTLSETRAAEKLP